MAFVVSSAAGIEAPASSVDYLQPFDIAEATLAELCAQGGERILHGDLHPYNILFDDAPGWVVIDSQGIVAELLVWSSQDSVDTPFRPAASCFELVWVQAVEWLCRRDGL